MLLYRPIIYPIIPFFDFWKWETGNDATLSGVLTDKVGTATPTFDTWASDINIDLASVPTSKFTFIQAVNDGGASGYQNYTAAAFQDFKTWWNGEVIPAFFNTYYDRIPALEYEQFKRKILAYMITQQRVILGKFQASYNWLAAFSRGEDSENTVDTLDGENTTTATITSDSARLDKLNNNPQVSVTDFDSQTYLDEWKKSTDNAQSATNANGTNDSTRTISRTRQSSLGLAPVEYIEMYFDKLKNLTAEIINDFGKFFTGDMLYV